MKRNKQKCQHCQKEISLSNIKIHENGCVNRKKPSFQIPESWKISDDKYRCGICLKEFSKMGMISHYWRSHTQKGFEFIQIQKPWENVIKVHPHSWNHGKTKKDHPSLKKLSESLINSYKNKAGTFTGKSHSHDTKRKMRFSAIQYIKSHLVDNQQISPRMGKIEKECLDILQTLVPYRILRSNQIDCYFPDGYIKELNIAIEFHELYHKHPSMVIRDNEKKIDLQKLGIPIFVIKEHEWIQNPSFVKENFLFFIQTAQGT